MAQPKDYTGGSLHSATAKVEALLKNKAKTELKKINSELKTLKLKIEELEERKKNLDLIIKV